MSRGNLFAAIVVRAIMRAIFFLTARCKIHGLEHLPRSGPAIIASNHISHFDPSCLTATSPRLIDWMAMQELFSHPVMARLFEAVRAFPVSRSGADRTALREAVRRLEEGRLVGIFPEGGIRHGEASLLEGATIQGGIGLLAGLSGAPLVPCVLLGTDRLYDWRRWLPFRRTPVWIAFGPPILAAKGVSREAARLGVCRDFLSATTRLRDEMVARYGLSPDDLPASPQERMRRAQSPSPEVR